MNFMPNGTQRCKLFMEIVNAMEETRMFFPWHFAYLSSFLFLALLKSTIIEPPCLTPAELPESL